MAEPYKEFRDLIVVLIGSIILDIFNHKIEIISKNHIYPKNINNNLYSYHFRAC